MRLKQLRKDAHLTQAQLAKELNIAQNTLSNWENGNRTPDAEMLKRIADYFHISIDEILAPETPPKFMENYLKERETRTKPDLSSILHRLFSNKNPSVPLDFIDSIPQIMEETKNLASSLRMIAIAINFIDADIAYNMPDDELITKTIEYVTAHEKELNADQVRAFNQTMARYALFIINIANSCEKPE